MTVAEAVSDIELRLTGGKPSDDQPLWRPQIKSWLFTVWSSLLPQYIDKFIDIPGQVIKEYNCQLVKSDSPQVVCGCVPRYYIELPTFVDDTGETSTVEVVGLQRNMGVVDVFIGEGRLERAVTRSELRILSDISDNEEFFYLLGDRIYVFGGHYPSAVRAHLALIVVSAGAYSDTDEFPAVGLLLDDVLKKAEEIGLRQMGAPQDITNDTQAAPASL